MEKTYYSHGKLLLSGEYAVLDGALALAAPTRKGQWLTVSQKPGSGLSWQSLTENGQSWYRQDFNVSGGHVHAIRQDPVSTRLVQLLDAAMAQNPGFLDEHTRYQVVTRLEFDRDWGLGSSSTLLSNIARWAGIDPFQLLDATFGGSGYDVAAATRESAFTYQRQETGTSIRPVQLQWAFKDQLYFVHLNQKQDSRKAIEHYRSREVSQNWVGEISQLTGDIVQCRTLEAFSAAVEAHEQLLSGVLGIPPVKSRLFPDYPGLVKSLGAWGGDFVLVSGDPTHLAYFRQKGYGTIIPFGEMLL